MNFLVSYRLPHTILLVSILAVVVMAPPAIAAPPSNASSQTGLTLLNKTSLGISLEWTAPELQIKVNAQGFLEISAPGLAQVNQPEELRLPFAAYLLVLPDNAQVDVGITSTNYTAQPLPASVPMNPRPQGVLLDEQGRPAGGAWAAVETIPVPGTQNVNNPVLLQEVGKFRGVRLARLVFYPALVAEDKLHLMHSVRLEITWDRSIPGDILPIEDPLLRQLKQQVINPWMVIPDAPTQFMADYQDTSFSAEVYLEIDRAGLFRVDYADLQPYGFSSVDPASIRLFQGNQEAAYRWEGDGDAEFEPGESLLFYAEHRFSRWTALDVYHLVSDPATGGIHMSQHTANPAGLPSGTALVEMLNEANLIYTPDCFCQALAGRDGDHWVWKQLRQPDMGQVSLVFSAPAVNSTLEADLSIWFISYTENSHTNPDHQIDASINGTSLGSLTWDGKQAITATLPIPTNTLLSGPNILQLSIPGAGVGFAGESWLDAFQVRYARGSTPAGQEALFRAGSGVLSSYTIGLTVDPILALDVTDSMHPVYLSGFTTNTNQLTLAGEPDHSYWLAGAAAVAKPKRIRPANNPWQFQPGGAPAGANYLIITHAEFASAMQPLIELRQAQGHVVAVVDVAGIYDVWGDGRLGPQAIRFFLSDAYSNWQPPPTYVLLVGDGSYDPRQNLSTTQPTFIPPYLADVDPWAGETAADNRFVAVSGTDILPDMLLGRLPVQSVAQAQAVVAKIVTYESEPYPGPWNANVTLVSDDQDSAGDFMASTYLSGSYLTFPFSTRYLTCPNQTKYSPGLDDCPEATAQQIHTNLLNLWNSGAFLVQFTGHSSWQQWAAERYFHLDDLATLQNGRRLPVVVAMTCFTGAFQRPEPTLDESLVLLPGSGAVAAWGASGLGVSTGHDSLSQGFFQATFQAGVDTLGQAALAGKLNLFVKGNNLDLVDTFNLLGDPALRFNRQIQPWAVQLFLPQVSR